MLDSLVRVSRRGDRKHFVHDTNTSLDPDQRCRNLVIYEKTYASQERYTPIQTLVNRLRTTALPPQVMEEEWHGFTLFLIASLSTISSTL